MQGLGTRTRSSQNTDVSELQPRPGTPPSHCQSSPHPDQQADNTCPTLYDPNPQFFPPAKAKGSQTT